MTSISRRAALVAGALAITLAGVFTGTAAADTTPQVVLIGDSLTLGIADDIEDHIPVNVIPLGVGGTTLDQTLAIGRTVLADPRYSGQDIVLWGGHRDIREGTPPASIVDRIQEFDQEVVAGGGRLIVLSLTNRPGDAQRGTPLYDRILQVNGLFEAQQRGEYLDVRSWLVRSGLAYRGITPTAQDRADIAVDVPPDSLRADVGNPGHLNDEEGKPAAGYRIAQHLIALPPPT